MIVDNELPGEAASLRPPSLCSPDCLTEVTACSLFTSHEVPLVISHKEAFDGYLDTMIGELLVCACVVWVFKIDLKLLLVSKKVICLHPGTDLINSFQF